MALLNPALLFGLFLVASPIILHLLLRAKPKKLQFPALRLIQNRRRQNVQRLRLKHLLLLLLRIAVLALLVLAITRPSLPAVDYSLLTGDWLRMLLLAGGAAGIYFAMLRVWRRQKLPAFVFAHHRSLLRGGLSLATLLLFLGVVAWPYGRRIAASVTQPTINVGDNLPVAAVMLFDTSLSMQYRYESKTRLELAQEIAAEHVSHLPSLSRVAVTDTSSDDPIRFQADLSGAQSRISGLTIHPVSRPLNDRLEAAIDVHIGEQERAAADLPPDQTKPPENIVREIYVLTDLAASAWQPESQARLKQMLDRAPSVNVYVIDVGVVSPSNMAVTSVTLSDQTLSLGGELTVRASIESTGKAASQQTVELAVENDGGQLVKQGQMSVRVDSSAAAQAQFSLRGLTGPVRQGEVRLVASDPLAFDDVRYFSIRVQPPQQILLVAESPAEAQFLQEALAPAEMERLGKARYRCMVIPPSKLTNEDLRRFAVVILLNVRDPQAAGWNALADYLKRGGGVAVVLGNRVDQAAYLTAAARAILPAELAGAPKLQAIEYLDLQNLNHPLLKKFADWGVAELSRAEIQRFWRVIPNKDATVIATFTDERKAPAFLDRVLEKGRILMFTSPFDRASGWNDLPAAGWSFIALADQMVQFLSGAAQNEMNFTAGAEVLVPLDAAQPLKKYLLRKPGKQQLPGEVPEGATALVLKEIDQLGNYRVVGADSDSKFESGFSVNPDPHESNLNRLPESELEKMLGGKERFSLARDIGSLQKKVRAGRVGREIFPMLLALLLLVFVAEHLVANRFYENQLIAK